ncbi:BCCT family transporter [Tyzzerella sp. An114]|uniref:BCCT family transporter n=1 Tax=Tyzzerella sp. An114 TaxID=1965545 RepID=UPI0023B8EAF3|nr:BCCT family transporter [Tyzzerella sp. An114]
MDKFSNEKTIDLSVKWVVFLPPWILLVAMVAVSLVNGDLFLSSLNAVTSWILDNFAWLFNATVIFCIFTVIAVYISPLGRVRIGGRKMRPIMSFTNHYMDNSLYNCCCRDSFLGLCRTYVSFVCTSKVFRCRTGKS